MPVAGFDEQSFRKLSAAEKALRKVQQGGCGICELCGQKIEVKRLQSIPGTERCLNCAARKVPMFESASEEAEELLEHEKIGQDDHLPDGGNLGVKQRLLERADVRIDGHRPWDLKLNDGRFFKRVFIATAFFAAIFN